MPPKPFKPPRPSSTTAARKSTTSKSTPTARSTYQTKTNKSAISKSKPGPKAKSTKASVARNVPHLPSLSPDSSPADSADVRNRAHRRESGLDDSAEEDEEEEEDDNDDDESLPSQPPLKKPRSKPRRSSTHDASNVIELDSHDDLPADDNEDERRRKQHIPPALLTLLLHTFLAEPGKGNEKIRIGKEANKAVGMYLDTFVREAIARAAWTREERLENEEGIDDGDGILEVEDLERIAPQLLMDF